MSNTATAPATEGNLARWLLRERLWVAGERSEAIARVPSELVIQANLLGSTEMVRERIRAYKNVGVTTLRVAPAGRDLREKLAPLGQVMDLVHAMNAGS